MRWFLAQRWQKLLFAHWRAEPRAVSRLLPAGVEPDVHDGSAWVAIVAFVMAGSRAAAGPAWRGLPPIPELNVRTYVRVDDVPGVWFLSLDTSSRLFVTVGRALFGLRYRLAHMTAVADGDRVHYLSEHAAARFSAAYEPAGAASRARPGSLEHFLVERYRCSPSAAAGSSRPRSNTSRGRSSGRRPASTSIAWLRRGSRSTARRSSTSRARRTR